MVETRTTNGVGAYATSILLLLLRFSCYVLTVCLVLLKDYLRELPNPLCTSSLYQMLMDALCVQVPDDEVGNAQLMFSILDCLSTVNQVL